MGSPNRQILILPNGLGVDDVNREIDAWKARFIGAQIIRSHEGQIALTDGQLDLQIIGGIGGIGWRSGLYVLGTQDAQPPSDPPFGALSTFDDAFGWVAFVVPPRVATEVFGDAMETIAKRQALGHPRWKLWACWLNAAGWALVATLHELLPFRSSK